MIIISFIFFIFLYTYIQYSTKYKYWSQRKVKHDVPLPFIGNMGALKYIFRFKSMVQFLGELCYRYPDEKLIGAYFLSTPYVIVQDPDLIRHILIDHFDHFHKRGLGRNPNVETNHKNPLHAEGDLWKLLRQRLTPVFTTAKLKAMFPLIIKCAKNLEKLTEEIVKNKKGECEIQSLLTRFNLEITGTCGFGIEVDTLKNENSRFIKLMSLISNPPFWNQLLHIIYDLCAFARPLLYVSATSVREEISEIVQTVLKRREYKQSDRNDFIDNMIKLLDGKIITGKSLEKTNPDGTPATVQIEVDISLVVAQVYLFFAVGADTSIAASSYTLHYLAYNPEVQERVQEDIDKVLLKYNNELSYDSIADMSLLQMSFFEAMRLLPPAGSLIRTCTKRYTFPGLNVTIDPGVVVLIPTQQIHKNPKYYVHPEEFIPERFSPENIQKRHKYTYLPFGAGPRQCIGSRMGEMQSLAGLAAILHKFTVEPSSKSTKELKLDPSRNVVQGIIGGLPLKLKLREKKN